MKYFGGLVHQEEAIRESSNDTALISLIRATVRRKRGNRISVGGAPETLVARLALVYLLSLFDVNSTYARVKEVGASPRDSKSTVVEIRILSE